MAAIPSLQAHGPLMQPPGQAITSIMRVGHLPVLAYARSAAMFFLFRSAISVPCSSGSPTMLFYGREHTAGLGKAVCVMSGMFFGRKVLTCRHVYFHTFNDGIQFTERPYEVYVGILASFRLFGSTGGRMNTVRASGCFLRAYSAT